MQKREETRVQSLYWEDLLEEKMATHSRILAWRIPWTEEPGGLQSMGLQELDMTEPLKPLPPNSVYTVLSSCILLVLAHF